MKNGYFIGIAGKTMGALAKAYQDAGWLVSGSDHVGVYPPISTYLKQNKIPYVEGYAAKNLPLNADLVVVGRSALLLDPHNPEYWQAVNHKMKVVSYPEALADILIKSTSVVIAGTYGKTTISALVAWILTVAGNNPSYMVSGISNNLVDGVKITDSNISVVEGDEPPALFENDLPKFMYYRPTCLLLTATLWDHPEIYPSQTHYLTAFQQLVRLLPPDGLLIYESTNVASSVVREAKCRSLSYSYSDTDADYSINKITFGTPSLFTVYGPQNWQLKVNTVMIGEANFENICGAVAMCHELGVADCTIIEALNTFKGVKTRLEHLGKYKDIDYYWDIAQHPQKVKGSLEALRCHFPDKKIICVFHPSMTALHYISSLDWYRNCFAQADVVLVAKLSFTGQKDRDQRVTGPMIVEAIKTTQPNVIYIPLYDRLFDNLKKQVKPNDIVIFMSSGGKQFTNFIDLVTGKAE